MIGLDDHGLELALVVLGLAVDDRLESERDAGKVEHQRTGGRHAGDLDAFTTAQVRDELLVDRGAQEKPQIEIHGQQRLAIGEPLRVVRAAVLDPRRPVGAAGESFAAITGLSRSDDRFWLDAKPEPEGDGELPPLADDLEADLSSAPADDLVPPNPETIVAWWTKKRQELRPDTRYIAGVPVDQAGLLRGLRESSTWRRHGIAFELLVRTQGLARVQTRMSTQTQSRQMDALASLPRVDGNRPFGQF